MKCFEQEDQVQRTDPTVPGEKQEGPGQEATHRTLSLRVLESPNLSRVVPMQQWSPASRQSEWLQFMI